MSRWSQGGGDTRHLPTDLKTWESGPRTPHPDTAGVPEWVTAGHNDDPRGLAIAVAHFREAHTTPAERAAVRAFNARPKPPTFPCLRCGKHAFDEPTVCFWCQR